MMSKGANMRLNLTTVALLLALSLSYPLPASAADTAGPSRGYLQSEENPERRVTYQGESQDSDARQDKQEVYRALQETCQRWTRWYNKDRSSHAAVQMNAACREAADYGRKELNLNTTARRVNPDARRPQSNSAGGGAVLVGNNSGRNESPRCQNLRRELDHIQSRLRAGYKVEEGERLKKRRRQIRDQIQQHC